MANPTTMRNSNFKIYGLFSSYICWYNRIHREKLTEYDVVLSKGYDLCEGCGECKNVVVKYRGVLSKSILKLIKK